MSDRKEIETRGLKKPHYRSLIRLEDGNGFGNPGNRVRRYSTVAINTGFPHLSLLQSAADGDAIYANAHVVVLATASDHDTAQRTEGGITLNGSTASDTGPFAGNPINRLVAEANDGTGSWSVATVVVLKPGEYIQSRTQSPSAGAGTGVRVHFQVEVLGVL